MDELPPCSAESLALAKRVLVETSLLVAFYQRKAPLSSQVSSEVREAYFIHNGLSLFNTMVEVLLHVWKQKEFSEDINRGKAEAIVRFIVGKEVREANKK